MKVLKDQIDEANRSITTLMFEKDGKGGNFKLNPVKFGLSEMLSKMMRCRLCA